MYCIGNQEEKADDEDDIDDDISDNEHEFEDELEQSQLGSQKLVSRIEDPGTMEMSNTDLIKSNVMNFQLFQNREFNAEDSFIQDEQHQQYQSHKKGWEINIMPEVHPYEWDKAQDTIERWGIFRLFPLIAQIQNLFGILENQQRLNQASKNTEVPKLGSLFIYYNLLPEFVRKDSAVVNLVRCLEYSKHDMNLAQKEIALNYIAQYALPLDKLTEDVMKEAYISQKYSLTVAEEDALLKEIGEDDEDPKDEQDTKKDLKIAKKENRIIEKQDEWDKPEQIIDFHTPFENLGEELPLQYYDNDDGFWDEEIKRKEINSSSLPMIHSRPFFKH